MENNEQLHFDQLCARILSYNSESNLQIIRRAYEFTQCKWQAIEDPPEPTLGKPLDIAFILAEVQSDDATLIAGMLCNAVDSDKYCNDQITHSFGDEVATLLDGTRTLGRLEANRLHFGNETSADDTLTTPLLTEEHAASIQKLYFAMTRDFRVLFIKMAERLATMRTLTSAHPIYQRRYSDETLQVYAAIANRLGAWYFQWQLEDLSFAYLNPQAHSLISEAIAHSRSEREATLEATRRYLLDRLTRSQIDAEIESHAEHLYSIWKRLDRGDDSLDSMLGHVQMRVMVGTIADCYNALAIVNDLWHAVPGFFADYIARPNPDAYQAIHQKVIGPTGEPIDMYILTWEMRQRANVGMGSRAVSIDGGHLDRQFEQRLSWLPPSGTSWSPEEYRDADVLEGEILDDKVFVLTPGGGVVELPSGSGPIDLAFQIHTELGLHCAGAKVNGRLVPFTYRLSNGETVEILTRPNTQPSYDWLNMVRTSHAKSRIRSWFRKQRHSENVVRGRDLLEREVARVGSDREILKSERLLELARHMNYQHEEDLLAAVGHGHVASATVVGRLRAAEPPKPQLITGRPAKEAKLQISAAGLDGLFIRRSRCCMPLPGDDVVGYISRGKGIAIHWECCSNIQEALIHEPDRIQRVDWASNGEAKYPVPLRIDTLDRVGVMADVSVAFSERKINIEKAHIRTLPTGGAIWEIVVDVANTEDLGDVIRVVSAIPDVLAVNRTADGRSKGVTHPSLPGHEPRHSRHIS